MKAKITGKGSECPKCRELMDRCSHKPEWKPKENQPYYFGFWDRCTPCRHVQHYEAAKVFRIVASDPTPVIWDEKNVDETTLAH